MGTPRPDRSARPKPIWRATFDYYVRCVEQLIGETDQVWRDDHNGLLYFHWPDTAWSFTVWQLWPDGSYGGGVTYFDMPLERAALLARCDAGAANVAWWFTHKREAKLQRVRGRR